MTYDKPEFPYRWTLADAELRTTLGVNQFEGREYLSQEALQALIDMRLLLEAQAWSARSGSASKIPKAVCEWWQVLEQFAADAEASSYCTDQLGITEAAAAPGTED